MSRAASEQVEKLRAAAIANGLERDEANDRLEKLCDALQRAYDRTSTQLEGAEKNWMLGTLDDLLRLARPARLRKTT